MCLSAGVLPTLKVNFMALGKVNVLPVFKLTKPKTTFSSSKSVAVVFKCPATLSSLTWCRWVWYLLGHKHTSLVQWKCTGERVCVRDVWVRYNGSYIAHLVVHPSPVLIHPFPLHFHFRELTRERERKKSAIRQKFPKVHITVLLSLIRRNKKIQKGREKKADTQSSLFSIAI